MYWRRDWCTDPWWFEHISNLSLIFYLKKLIRGKMPTQDFRRQHQKAIIIQGN